MAKLVDLDNEAYATYVALTANSSNPPTEPTYFHAPPSFLNSYHIEEPHVQISKTWKEARKVTAQQQMREEDEALFSAVSGSVDRTAAAKRREKMQGSSLNLGYDGEGAQLGEGGRKKLPDHTAHVWLEDARRQASRKFGKGTSEELLKERLRKSSVTFGNEGESEGDRDTGKGEERRRSTAREGMLLRGADRDVKKYREQGARRKKELMSTSAGMKLGEGERRF